MGTGRAGGWGREGQRLEKLRWGQAKGAPGEGTGVRGLAGPDWGRAQGQRQPRVPRPERELRSLPPAPAPLTLMCFFTTSVRSRRISSGMPISSQMSRSVAIARFRHDTVSAANTSLRAAGTGRQRRHTARATAPAAPCPGSPRRAAPRPGSRSRTFFS